MLTILGYMRKSKRKLIYNILSTKIGRFEKKITVNDTKIHYTRMNCNIDRSFIEIATQSIAEDL